jgi:GNAT superfamily N-acetyltransferase
MVLSFRYAEEKDSALICEFIRALADYENLLDQVVATEALIKDWVFKKKKAEVIFALVEGKEVGFALYFHNFSTFAGKAGLYIEDLYVKPEFRGQGYGKALLKKLAQIAVGYGCGRMEWVCLDWNQPSIDVYLSLGAKPMDEWTVYRLSEEHLADFAAEKIGS